MSKLTDKAAYIKGLAEGMKLEEGSDESKLLLQLIDAVSEIAASVEELEEAHDELSDFVDSIDEDLEELEDTLGELDDEEDFEDDFEDDEEAFEDDDFEECEGNCGECGECEGCEGGEIYVECVCPECHALFYALEEDVDTKAKFICPRCGKKVEALMDYEDDIPVAKKAEDDE